jgi:multidrug resistance efflux pump
MIAVLALIYGGLIWLLFYKLKVVKPNAKSWTIAVIVGVVVIGWILLSMNLFQPYSKQAVVSQYVVQIAPQVTGRVIEVPVSPNAPIKKGDVLFKIDPESFQATVDGLRAGLVQAEQNAKSLQDNLASAKASVEQARAGLVSSRQQVTSLQAQLDGATAAVAQATAQRDLARDQYERVAAAKAEDPGAVSDVSVDTKRQSSIAAEDVLLQAIAQEASVQASVDSVLGDENTLVVQAKAQLASARAAESKAQLAVDSVIDGENTSVAQIRAQLRQAQLNLSWTTVQAPADGFVTNLQLREGFVVGAGSAVMSFIDSSERYLVVPLKQSVVRHVKPGDDVEIALELYPGKILPGTVDSVIWATGEGQGDPSGALPDLSTVQGGQALAVRVTFGDLAPDMDLPVGAGGAAAIYTSGGKPFRIIRKVIIRMYTFMNYL